MGKDLVCGMKINPETAKVTVEYKETIYYFCSRYCKEEFEKNSEKYLKKKNFVARFIDWLGKESNGKPRSCH
ncbi:MAG: YHS domain-containing protein [Elusimicrobiota bacterium]